MTKTTKTDQEPQALQPSQAADGPARAPFPGVTTAAPGSPPPTIGWSGLLDDLSPVELAGGHWYKREDKAAPLGYGSINGSKLRQLAYLVGRYVAAGGRGGIVTGASVLSPQVSMSALVARRFGLPCVIVLGATRYESAVRHPNVAIAAAAGAEFIFTPVAYNPALQRAVAEIAGRPEFAGWYRLHYGITTPDDSSPAAVEAFHAVGAAQVANVPPSVRTLVMTAGSCNSCTSVLYGIALHRPAGLERVVLLGVGPTRLDWLERRLCAIGEASGVPVPSLYRRVYHDHPGTEPEVPATAPFLLEHWDLHSTRFASYQDRMPFTADGIDFHPTYEGKAMRFMARRRRHFRWWWEADGDALFWIVGSAPSVAA